MHEKLRTSFKLQRNDAEWQRLTSDLMYNTFFSIYAKFYYEENSFKPTSCDLKIQNFQGAVTIGLDCDVSQTDNDVNQNQYAPIELKEVFDKLLKKYVYVIIIKLKALHAKPEIHNIPINMIPRAHFNFLPKDKTKLEFSEKNLMYVGLEYKPLHEDSIDFTKENEINSLKFIDSARYLRDGDQLQKISLENLTKPLDSTLGIKGFNLTNPHVPNIILEEREGGETLEEFVFSRACRDVYVNFF